MASFQAQGIGQYPVRLPMERATCWAKRRWYDPWQFVPFAFPEQSVESAFPNESEATAEWEYGVYTNLWGYGASYLIPLNIQNWFFGIQVHTVYGNYISFIGQVVGESIVDEGIHETGLPRAVQTVHCKGLEYLLSRRVVTGTYAKAADGSVVYLPVTRTFNRRHRQGLSLSGNRSADIGPHGTWTFSNEGQLWSNLSIISYLLTYFQPDEPRFVLTGQYAALDYIYQEWNLHGMRVWDALNLLIDRRRGFGVKIRSTGYGAVEVHVFSLSQTQLVGTDLVVPANRQQIDVPVNNDLHIETTLDILSMAAHDQIVVESEEPIKTTWSPNFAAGTIQAAWTNAEEQAYKLATDIQRGSDAFARVYKYFRIPRDFVPYGVTPYVDNLGNIYPDILGAHWLSDTAFLRYLPWYDPTAAAEAEPEHREPFALIMTNPEDEVGPWTYQYLEKLALNELPTGFVRMADRELAVEVGVGDANHALALLWWGESESSVSPVLEYTTLILTVNQPTDQKPRVVLPVMFGGQVSYTGRQIYIEVPGVEVWLIANNTVYDVDPNTGQPILWNNGLGSIYRDDTYKLRAIAMLAWVWYGQQRATASMTIKNQLPWFGIGNLIRSTISGLGWQRVGTVVTSITRNYQEGTQEVKTGYCELEPEAFAETVR